MKQFSIIIALFLVLAVGVVYAQEFGDPDPYMIGIESAQQQLKEVSVEKFEHEGFWFATMSGDEGYVSSRLFYGGPSNKQPIPEEEGLSIPDE